jgi:hypothetical protein
VGAGQRLQGSQHNPARLSLHRPLTATIASPVGDRHTPGGHGPAAARSCPPRAGHDR